MTIDDRSHFENYLDPSEFLLACVIAGAETLIASKDTQHGRVGIDCASQETFKEMKTATAPTRTT